MRVPVSRRSLLLAGVGGTSLGLLSACGLRLDTEPEIPTLDAGQQLRNRIVRILAATTPSDGDPETAGDDLATFSAALGPEWNPPDGYATESADPEPERTYIAAAEVVAQSVFEASPRLGSDLIPLLSDVATGLTLTAGQKKPELISTADELIRSTRAAREAEATPSPDDTPAGDQGGQEKQDGQDRRTQAFNAILNQSRAAAYGYERLAVNFARKSAERTGALARLESLGALSGQMLELLGEGRADPNASAWKLDPTPTDRTSATELALNLEDGLVSALLAWLATDTSAILRLWESARARTIFAQPQPLRFDYTDRPGAAGVGVASATGSATAEAIS